MLVLRKVRCFPTCGTADWSSERWKMSVKTLASQLEPEMPSCRGALQLSAPLKSHLLLCLSRLLLCVDIFLAEKFVCMFFQPELQPLLPCFLCFPDQFHQQAKSSHGHSSSKLDLEQLFSIIIFMC